MVQAYYFCQFSISLCCTVQSSLDYIVFGYQLMRWNLKRILPPRREKAQIPGAPVPLRSPFLFCLILLCVRFPKVGGPQVSAADCKQENLRTQNIWQISGHSANLAIGNQGIRSFFVICGFAIYGPIYFCGQKTSANPQDIDFLLTNIDLCSQLLRQF